MNSHKFTYSVILILIFYFIHLRNCDRSGNYKITVERLEECSDLPGNHSDIKWNAKYFRYNKTAYAVNATVDIPFYIDNKIKIRFHVLKWGDGGWKYNYFKMEQDDPCYVVHLYFGKFIKSLFRTIGIKNPDKCPIEPGFYQVYNLHAPLDLIDVPFFYGRFKLIIDAFRLKKRIGCVTWIGSLTEKTIHN